MFGPWLNKEVQPIPTNHVMYVGGQWQHNKPCLKKLGSRLSLDGSWLLESMLLHMTHHYSELILSVPRSKFGRDRAFLWQVPDSGVVGL